MEPLPYYNKHIDLNQSLPVPNQNGEHSRAAVLDLLGMRAALNANPQHDSQLLKCISRGQRMTSMRLCNPGQNSLTPQAWVFRDQD